MNKAFANSPFVFNLVSVDETTNDDWYDVTPGTNAERQMKSALRIGTALDLNLYVARLGRSILGFANLPKDYEQKPVADGVVIVNELMPGGLAIPYNEGDTATHEIGHWMGLYHTFQNGCSAVSDRVSDTPPERTPSWGCPVGRDSCSVQAGVDPIHNFMNYSNDPCMTEFTEQQAVRMDQQWAAYRAGK